MQVERIYINQNEPINFTFIQNAEDFKVDEVGISKYTNHGRFAICKIKKTNITTWDMIKELSIQLDISENQIGYAGLKDKNATTTQYISLPLEVAQNINLFKHHNIQIEELNYSDSPIQKGDLAGNKFTIMLHNIDDKDLYKIYQNISHVQKHGMPNYFGYQRFGFDDKYEKSQAVARGEETIKDKKLQHLLVSIYQSYLFNNWLVKRVALSKEKGLKKLLELDGDIFDYKQRDIITGLMAGNKIPRAKKEARDIEVEFDDEFVVDFKGYHRIAWVKPQNIKNKFNSENNSMLLEFVLPKSSYATVFVENLANKNFGNL
jgi:tRNA pseudouridine13 synthase